MDYPLEQLGPEKFQRFCQALLAREFPDVTCFPVGQPDGGRDALQYVRGRRGTDVVVYQVKFVRNPAQLQDAHKWLADIVRAEAPKMAQLITRGATRYVLITNVSGTAHVATGAIDVVADILEGSFDIPATCWWRDDVNRRLDSAWDLKWTYPELMTGPDLIRSIVAAGLTEHSERRELAIRAFLRAQYEQDREVKFRQVDLQNDLFELFIDVPLIPSQLAPQQLAVLVAVGSRLGRKGAEGGSPYTGTFQLFPEHRPLELDQILGTADFLLDEQVQEHLNRLVLEGAPGQGKSTIAQYVCQVHRIRLLNRQEHLAMVPEAHRAGPVRLPFKVDLRDLARWLTGLDPFSSETTAPRPHDSAASLETFLAAQVAHWSGGAKFDVADLQALVKISSVLVVLDGLDEIADIARRQKVVDEIRAGVARLEENAGALQVVVTSRPAAFANSPGLPEKDFPYYRLASVDRDLVEEYAGKWLKARRLEGKEASEVRRILREKLDHAHLRDLARNPMQLAILLSLIHTRGTSLPDKRTALYDAYVELFFNREAEKSEVVREHRELLINIHRFLAWILHSEAETEEGSGSLPADRLQGLLESYLRSEGHDPELSATLFKGMVERVVAIVSRVEGTYEFEVQPLREYFAARFLYETAPYSPTGSEGVGTKPDRFDAVARDFYWLNVARFYAGCYSTGELASLIEGLADLLVDPAYKTISHTRVLAATLLADWVFSQTPKLVDKVVDLIFDRPGLLLLTLHRRRAFQGSVVTLPERCGRREAVKRAVETLRGGLPFEHARGVLEFIRANCGEAEVDDIWWRGFEDADARTKEVWTQYGVLLGTLARASVDRVECLYDGLDESRVGTTALLLAGRDEVLEGDARLYEESVAIILDGSLARLMPHNSLLRSLAWAVEPYRYRPPGELGSPPGALRERWARWQGHGEGDLALDKLESESGLKDGGRLARFLRVADEAGYESMGAWGTTLAPWEAVVEAGRSLYGERWAFCRLATLAAGIKSREETCEDAAAFADPGLSMCRRFRHARLRAGAVSYWRKLLSNIEDPLLRLSAVHVLVTWGGARTMVKLLPRIDEVIAALTVKEWKQLYSASSTAISGTMKSANRTGFGLRVADLPDLKSPRTAVVLGLRVERVALRELFERYLRAPVGTDEGVGHHVRRAVYGLLMEGEIDWDDALGALKATMDDLSEARDDLMLDRYGHGKLSLSMPAGVVNRVLENPLIYPAILVSLAEERMRQLVAGNVVPVGTIAARKRWFEGQWS